MLSYNITVVIIITMTEFRTLKHYEDKTLEEQIYTKYEINECCVIRHKKSKKSRRYDLENGYYRVTVTDDVGKRKTLSVSRTMLSTFIGKPPSPLHTADHIQPENKTDNRLSNLRWADDSEQRKNQNRLDTQNNAYLVVHGGEEMTVKEWVVRLGVSRDTILYRAQNEKNVEWSYKIYDDIVGEIWKDVKDSKNLKGWWMASNFGRVAYHTNHARKIYYPGELSTQHGYPRITINGKGRKVHLVVFETFRPEEYNAMQKGEMILHENDDKMDCRIDKLRIGIASNNMRDAYDNGKHDGKKSQRTPCVAQKDGKTYPFKSQRDAVQWIRTKTCYKKASFGNISRCLNGTLKTAYGYTWSFP
jgi:hypothetical protein